MFLCIDLNKFITNTETHKAQVMHMTTIEHNRLIASYNQVNMEAKDDSRDEKLEGGDDKDNVSL